MLYVTGETPLATELERAAQEAGLCMTPWSPDSSERGTLVLADFFRSGRDLPGRDEALLQSWFHQWAVPDLDSLVEFDTALTSAGFTEVDCEEATDRIRPSATRLNRLGWSTAPAALLFRLLRIHSADQHANWKSSILQQSSLRKGLWQYGIFTARKPN